MRIGNCGFLILRYTFSYKTTLGGCSVGDLQKASKPADPAVGRFPTTQWSLVLSARRRTPEGDAAEALASLCQTYWYPLYAFVRRRGLDREAAEDLIQGFFSRLLEKNYIEQADPGKGRFRAFLLTSVKHYLANEWDRSRAQKRGGGRVIVSLDPGQIDRFERSSVFSDQPEQLFDRDWAMRILEEAIETLRREMEERGRGDRFEHLIGFVAGDEDDGSYLKAAESLSIREGAVRVAVFRMRRRLAQLIREEVARTLRDPDRLDSEIQYLFEVLNSESSPAG